MKVGVTKASVPPDFFLNPPRPEDFHLRMKTEELF